MTIREQIQAAIAKIRGQQVQMSAEERAELDRVEAVAKGDVVVPPAAVATANPTPAPVAVDPALSAQIKAQGEQIAALTGILGTLTTTLTTQQSQARLDANTNQINALVRAFKLTPAQADEYRKLAADNPATFEACLPMLQLAPVIKQQQRDSVRVKPTAGANASAGDQLVMLTEKRMKETGENYQTAFIAVVQGNRDLAAQHEQDRPIIRQA